MYVTSMATRELQPSNVASGRCRVRPMCRHICARVKPRELRKHVTILQREIAMTKGPP